MRKGRIQAYAPHLGTLFERQFVAKGANQVTLFRTEVYELEATAKPLAMPE